MTELPLEEPAMRRPLLVAVPGALLGFGGWIWLTGPGTSVPNALLALLCAVFCGRLAWWAAARGASGEGATEAARREADRAPAPPRAGRRAPPPVDPEPWRRPDGEP